MLAPSRQKRKCNGTSIIRYQFLKLILISLFKSSFKLNSKHKIYNRWRSEAIDCRTNGPC